MQQIQFFQPQFIRWETFMHKWQRTHYNLGLFQQYHQIRFAQHSTDPLKYRYSNLSSEIQDKNVIYILFSYFNNT